MANSGSQKIGNGWVESEDLLEKVKGLKVGRVSGSEGGENDRNRRDRRDKNEARRAGDWEMVLSTTKPTGDWFGGIRAMRQVSESIIEVNRLHSANRCGDEGGGVDRVERSSAEIGQSKSSRCLAGEGRRAQQTGASTVMGN